MGSKLGDNATVEAEVPGLVAGPRCIVGLLALDLIALLSVGIKPDLEAYQ